MFDKYARNGRFIELKKERRSVEKVSLGSVGVKFFNRLSFMFESISKIILTHLFDLSVALMQNETTADWSYVCAFKYIQIGKIVNI